MNNVRKYQYILIRARILRYLVSCINWSDELILTHQFRFVHNEISEIYVALGCTNLDISVVSENSKMFGILKCFKISFLYGSIF
jgi:hypothetical protein